MRFSLLRSFRILSGCLALLVFAARLSAQNYTVDDFQAGLYTDASNNSLPYRLFVPANYDPNHKYPLVVFLHGVGESGTDNRNQLVGQKGELVYVNQSLEPVFMLAPQAPVGSQWVNVPFSQGSYSIASTPISTSLATVFSLQNYLEQQYNIDANRLYLTGLSMGGYGTWDLSLRHPGVYAAIVPMSGAGDPSLAAKLVETPVWDFHGAQDGVVPVSGSRDMIHAIENAGGSPLYTEYPNGDHDIWDIAYHTPDLVAWTFAQHLSPAAVPEPGSLALLAGIGAVGVGFLRRRKTSTTL